MFLVPEDTQRNSLTSERARKRTRSPDLARSPTPKRRRLESSLQKEESPIRKTEVSHEKYKSTLSQLRFLSTYKHRRDRSRDSYWRHRSSSPPTQQTQEWQAQTLDQDRSKSRSMVGKLSGREELFLESNRSRLPRRFRQDSTSLRHRY